MFCTPALCALKFQLTRLQAQVYEWIKCLLKSVCSASTFPHPAKRHEFFNVQQLRRFVLNAKVMALGLDLGYSASVPGCRMLALRGKGAAQAFQDKTPLCEVSLHA